MKRKLDANDVPSTEASEAPNAKEITFEDLNLDPRIRQALVKENFSKPTLVQSEAIPLALEGKDILGKFISLESNLGIVSDANLSTCENRLGKDGGLRTPHSTVDYSEKSGM
jgi:hypothetical protein